ncbi:MAG: DNA polymerase III subunit beta [Eubacteriales bacterium]|nr:DNA polymerase III subunit beta [Eubacteriales bacterium]
MQFTCEKSILQEAITTASRAVSNKSSIALLEGLLITAESDGRLTLCGYNMSMGIRAHIDAGVTEPGSAVLNARLFGDMIRKLPDDIISVETNEQLLTTIRCGKAMFNLVASDAQDFPQLPEVETSENPILLPQSMLKSMISQTIFAVSDNEAKPVLTGCLFELEGQELHVAAVDGYRLGVRREHLEAPTPSDTHFVVPGPALREVERILSETDEQAEIYPDTRHILFRIGDTVLITRLLEGEFLNYRAAIPTEAAAVITADVRQLIASIERVSLIVSEKLKNPVRMEFDGPLLRMSCITTIGKSYDEYMYEGDVPHLEIGFNNRYLLDALRACPSDKVRISLQGSLNPIVFSPEEGDAFTYLVLPVRLKAE